jgi:hypothetical protein
VKLPHWVFLDFVHLSVLFEWQLIVLLSKDALLICLELTKAIIWSRLTLSKVAYYSKQRPLNAPRMSWDHAGPILSLAHSRQGFPENQSGGLHSPISEAWGTQGSHRGWSSRGSCSNYLAAQM